MVSDGSWTFCGDHFVKYKYEISVHCAQETKITLYIYYN